jgi:fumarylpyruvate hydrolase
MDTVIPPQPQAYLPVRGARAVFPVHRIYCVGRNYAAHAIEMGHDPSREEPFFFQKNPDNLVIDGGDFPVPGQVERRAARDRAGGGAVRRRHERVRR